MTEANQGEAGNTNPINMKHLMKHLQVEMVGRCFSFFEEIALMCYLLSPQNRKELVQLNHTIT